MRLAVGNYSAIKSGLSPFPTDSSLTSGRVLIRVFPSYSSQVDGQRESFLARCYYHGRRTEGELGVPVSLRDRETQQETGRRAAVPPLSTRAPPGWKVRSEECRGTWLSVWRTITATTRHKLVEVFPHWDRLVLIKIDDMTTTTTTTTTKLFDILTVVVRNYNMQTTMRF